jgi:class 3 adenylate cyclase
VPSVLAPPLEALLSAQALRGERLVNRVRIFLAAGGAALILTAGAANSAATNVVLLVQVLGWAGYSLWHRWFTGEGRRGETPWLMYLSLGVDLGLSSLAYLAAALNHDGVVEYWRGGVVTLFAFWNLLAGLRSSERLCLWAAGATLSINVAFALHTVLGGGVGISADSRWSGPSVAVADLIGAALFASVPGVIAGLVARTGRALLVRVGEESERRSRLEEERSRLGKFLSPDVVAMVLREPGALRLGGQRRRATLMFLDLRSFMARAEALPPEVTVDALNALFGRLVAVVFRWGGTLDKFLGDGFMAAFGVPVDAPDAAARAVLAAAELVLEAEAFGRDDPRAAPLGSIRVGIGLATGDVVFGSIGTENRMEMTCIGSSVNLSARLQGLAAAEGAVILMDEATARAAPRSHPPVLLGARPIKGFSEPVPVWVLDPAFRPSERPRDPD